ncbi:MAG: SprA-related family protein [Desulfobacteraceae bacterium]|nr:SprA-related family protein [Desulfobacteraceae bacterium]
MNINTIQNSHIYSSWQPNAKQPDTINNAQIKNNQIVNKSLVNNNAKDNTTNTENQDSSSAKKEVSSEFARDQEAELTNAEKALVTELKQIDQAVRKHEMAHVTAGGRYILSGANYSYKTGPDGKRYIVGGEVSIDTSEVPGDPQATINKMQQVRRAALAPVDPSPQDRRVASTATSLSTKAVSELMIIRAKEKIDSDEEKAFGNIKQTAENAYANVQNMPGNQQEPFFRISA